MRSLRTHLLGLSLALLAPLVGCGGDAGKVSGSCDTRSTNGACIEYKGSKDVVGPYETQCGAGWSKNLCNRTDSVGGCAVKDDSLGLEYISWFFGPNFTVETAMQSCVSPGMFTTP